LLLPAAFELDLYDFFLRMVGEEAHSKHSSPDADLPSLFFMAVLAQVLGEAAARQIWQDAALCRVLGLQSPPGIEAVGRLAQAVAAQQPGKQGLRSYWEAHWEELARRRGFFWRTGGEPDPAPSYEGLAEMRSNEDPQPAAIQRLNSFLRPISARLAQRFASTLGSFSTSSLDYLRRNFLDGAGEIEFTSGRIVCRLPDRPLALVLKMAGVENRPVPLPWVPGVDLEFHLE
jgi:hypothetical protein